MSEDASSTGGPVTPPQTLAGQDAATDHNNSIIEKVRSRVTSIIPFGKWFSPTASGALTPISGEQGSHNGGVRRRRDDTVIGEQATSGKDRRVAEESDTEDLAEEDIAPPTKRSRLNVPEDQSLLGSFQIARGNTSNNFLSSTPHIGARKHLNLKSINQPLHSTISSSITTTRTTKSTTSNLVRDVPQLQSDTVEHDVLEVIPENQNVVNYGSSGSHWKREQRNSTLASTSGIRELKLPTRRPSLHRSRLYASEPTSAMYSSFLASSSYQNQDEDDTFGESTEDESKKNTDALTNGVRASPNPLSVDTASESGESQASSVQKAKVTEPLYIAGVKRFRSANGSGLNYAAHLQGKKSLFGDKNTPSYLNNSTTSLTSLNRRQSFNTSLYGSTSALSDSRLLNTYSPFYKGNTTYGGAAAYSKYSQNARRANPVPTLIRPSSSLSTSSSIASSTQAADTSATISNTAKRILELMNQFTTPLSDAKKMASNTKVPALTAHRQRFNETDRSMNKGIRMTTPKTPYSRPTIVQSKESKDVSGPPVNELHVPSMSQLLQMKKLQSNTERAREITRTNQAKTLAAVKSSSVEQQEYRLPSAVTAEESTSKHVNKIKNKLTSTRASSKNIEDDMLASVVSLPDIPLPLKESAVPKIDFNFGRPVSASNSATTSKGTDSSPRNSLQSKDNVSVLTKEFKAPKTSSSGFSFGNTITKSSESSIADNGSNTFKFNSPTVPKVSTPVANGGHEFVFSAPLQVTAPTSGSSNQVPVAAAATNFKFSDPVPVENSPKLSTPAGNFAFETSNSASIPKPLPATNTQSTIAVVAPQLKTAGSVLDVFKKPTPAEATSTSVSSTGSFGAQFKMSSDKWECSVCMIRNDKSADKCVACCTAKPSSEPAKTGPSAPIANANVMKSSTPLVPLTNSFGDKFKASANTWECSVCMIRNKIELSNCAACSSAKPGSSSTSTAASATKPASMVTSSSSLVPNKTTDSGFKSLVATQSAKWECSACLTRNEPARNKCACCEQAKPGASSENVPQFAFGASSALPTDSKFTFGFGAAKNADELKKADSAPAKHAGEIKQSLGFGAPSAPTAAAPGTSFSFGFKPASTAEQNKDETDKSTASPKVTFASATQAAKSDSVSETSNKTSDPSAKKDPEPTGFKFGSSSSAFSPSTFSLSPAANTGQSKSTSSGSSSSTTLTTSPSSIFKPIGTVAFASNAEKKAEEPAKAPMFGFGSSETKQVSTEASSGKTGNDSNSGAEKMFIFGTTPSFQDDKPSAEVKPATRFTFGSSSVAGGATFKTPLAQKTAPTVSATASQAGNATSFVFGKPSTPASITPTFGAVSSNVITSSNATGPVATSAPSFGALSASSTVSSFQSTSTSSLVSAATFGSSSSLSGNQPTTNLFGSSSFNSASSSNATPENKPASNLFQFGAASKPTSIAVTATTAAAPIFGNVSSTTSGRFSFGSSSTASSAAGPSSQPAAFVFGSSSNADKAKESTPVALFGSSSAPGQNSTAATPSLPAFGSFSSPLQTQQVATGQQSTQPTLFGQTSNLSSPFGSNLAANTPTFGSATTATAAAVAPSAMGSTFGSGNTPALFGNGFNSAPAQNSDEPASKKRTGGFNFGAASANPTGGFTFGASTVNNNNNNNESKPFSFSASGGTPSFNFTGNSEATNSSQPFQFGAPQITPAAFNFSGIETTPNAPFQFNAAPAANNIFAVTPTPGTAQSAAMARRKARTVTRRTQPR